MDKIEYRIEKSNRKTAWTYCIYEDKEKGKIIGIIASNAGESSKKALANFS